MIDLATETKLTFAEAAGHVPAYRPGRKTSVSTIHRWSRRGVRGVFLEYVRLGTRYITSLEALQRFADRSTADEKNATPAAAPLAAQTTVIRQRAIERAERELEAAGF